MKYDLLTLLLQEMGLLEVKHGLLQIAETLDFLHNNARLIHRSISPEVSSFGTILFGCWLPSSPPFLVPRRRLLIVRGTWYFYVNLLNVELI